MFRNGQAPHQKYGENRDWNVDLIPKFVMANGIFDSIITYTLNSFKNI